MIRLPLLLSLLFFLCSCGAIQSVSDNAQRTTLALPHDPSATKSYAAPIFNVNLPSFLNEATVWYTDENGTLTALDNYIWAESLTRAIQRELALALATDEPYPSNSRFQIYFARFILMNDGSGVSVSEFSFGTPSSSEVLPIISVTVKDAWDPSKPSTYLEGYRALLAATIKEMKTIIPSPSDLPPEIPEIFE
ncbi:MAG: hypothetical protein ACQKBT_08040 [Puniceicoccales bacterium]